MILPTLHSRALHVVSENQRVRAAAVALKAGDDAALGEIMELGYQSSRDHYENSTPELDELHDLTASLAGVLGVRICGAGWGGCLLALVEQDHVDNFGNKLVEEYKKKSGANARTWTVKPSAGAGPL